VGEPPIVGILKMNMNLYSYKIKTDICIAGRIEMAQDVGLSKLPLGYWCLRLTIPVLLNKIYFPVSGIFGSNYMSLLF
jgi:hypothetical protein